MHDYIPIGIFGENEKELYLQKHRFTRNDVVLDIVVDEEPVRAGIDPYTLLIDRDREDNVVEVKAR